MKKLLIGVAAVIGVLLVAVIVVPMLVPLDAFRDELATQVEDATGRTLTIGGDMSLSLFPRLEVEVGKVSFSNMEGGQSADMATLEKLQVRLRIFPLISGDLVVDKFVLVDPIIHLEIDRKGRANWQFEAEEPDATPMPGSGTSGVGQGGIRPPEEVGGGPVQRRAETPDTDSGPEGIRFGDVRLVNGRVSYSDARTGETQTVEAINMTLYMPQFESKFAAEGGLTWNGEKIGLEIEVGSARNLVEGRTTSLEAEVESAPIRLSYKGSLKNAEKLVAAGMIDLKVPSVRELVKWTGQPLEGGGSGLGPLSLSGRVGVAGDSYSFENAALSLDNMNAKGELRVDLRRTRPVVRARLDVDKIDLNVYSRPAAAPQAQAAPARAGAQTAARTAPVPAKSPPASAAKTDWSDEPIDFSGLGALDADLDLRVGAIYTGDIKIGRTALRVALNQSVLDARLTEMALYGGRGTARIAVNARHQVPRLQKSVRLTGFQARPFFRDSLDFDRVEGNANASLSVTTRGVTERQLITGLQGSGNLRFSDGAIRGINLAALVRNVVDSFRNRSAWKTQKTDFTELTGTFTIKNGIVRNGDLRLMAPLMRLAGRGTVDLPRRRMNYRVEPKVVRTAEGQGGRATDKGLTVPVVIKGPWNDLSYQPDAKGVVGRVVEDPDAVKKTLKRMRSDPAANKKKAKKALKRLFR